MEGILARANLEVFKEPRGFIKILQFVLSICAFATTTSFSSYVSFGIYCIQSDVQANKTVEEEIMYPFQIDKIHTEVDACGTSIPLFVRGNFSSDAQFFVVVGILALFYVLVAIGLYCFFNDLYENNEKVPIVDFGVHVTFAILWLAASCAWANSLSGLRSAVKLANIFKYNDLCAKYICKPVTEASFGKLISSVIFGFLNTFVWSSNLWFLYKETKFNKDKKAAETVNEAN